ncbi:MAG TPA: hypothetical protein PKA64_00785 [Myxococcota bacterium]|nr:hypothetical protein [Myxococcota bacterium]
MNRPTPLLLLLTCCVLPDADGDGLPNASEITLGTDPHRADSDDDGLSDFEEAAGGTDPLMADSDGDGDLDGFEVEYGLDPTSADSHSYTMGWPMTTPWEKSALQTSPPQDILRLGARMERAWLLDVAGEVFDLYDYAGTGKPTIIGTDVWSNQGADLVQWARGEGWSPLSTPQPWIRDEVLSGTINYATIVTIKYTPQISPATIESIIRYCNIDMPTFGCFADTSLSIYNRAGLVEGFDLPGYRFYLLDEHMIIRSIVRSEDIVDENVFDDFHAAVAQMLGIEVPPDP